MSILSTTILAKDVIGQAQELAAVEDARLLIKQLGTTYYNMAMSEIYNMLSHLDPETFQITETIATTGTLPETEFPFSSLASPIDKIEAFKFDIDGTIYQCFGLQPAEYVRHEQAVKAIHPYEDSVVFSERDQKIRFLGGVNVPTTGSVTLDVIYKRQFTVLTSVNFASALMDLPDKYVSVVISRIASYAEVREGITDKALASVRMSYDGMLANSDAEYKNNIMKSLQYNKSYAPAENPTQRGGGLR